MKEQSGKIFTFDNFRLDVGNRQLRRDNKPLSLSPKAFDLLLALVENTGQLMEKDELFKSVWQDQIVEESNLTVYISQIRKALGETRGKQHFIETVPGYGYRFVGDVSNLEDEAIIIETETLSRITIETESELSVSENGLNTAQAVTKSVEKRVPSKIKYLKYLAVSCAVLVCLTLAFSVYFLKAKTQKNPFEKIKLTRLTNNGRVLVASVSTDGNFIAYVLGEVKGNSLWVRQTGAENDLRIVPPVKAEFWGLTFTPDGKQIYYNLFSSDKTDAQLFRIPTLGGVAQSVGNVISHSISFAPDGQRFAYIQPDSAANKNYLVIADADGTNQQIIAQKPQPNTFIFGGGYTAWSPDGESIACLINNSASGVNYNSIVRINVYDGTESTLSDWKWNFVASFEWVKDGSGLLVSGSPQNSPKSQIWFVPQPSGEPVAITDDLKNYNSIHTITNGSSFIALQTESVKSISVGDSNGEENTFKEIVSEVGVLNPLAWTPDGKLIFRSSAGGTSNLWTIDADGENRRQLTADAKADGRGMCVTPEGKYIVFVSSRSGKSNLWRINTDGTDLIKLTDAEADAYPSCSLDGQTIIYQQGIISQPHLWKIPIAGGEPQQLTEFRAKWSAVSNDGNRLSFFQMADDKWQIGIISSAGGAILQRLEVPAELKESKVQWFPDNDGLFFISTIGNVGNVWKLPLDGGKMTPVTNFKTHYLDDFSRSPDGTKLAVSRSTDLSDLVLIETAK